MKKEFEISMVGELTFFLGLQVKQKKEGIFISQEKYARNIVKKFGLDSKKHASIPMSSSTKLNVDSSKVEVSPTLYRSIIGSLLYLTASRPNIAFSVGVCISSYSEGIPPDYGEENHTICQWHSGLWLVVLKGL